MITSRKNWSQVHVYTVRLFESFLPTPIVLTNAEIWDLQSAFHFGFGSTGLFCSLLLKPCLLKLKSCFPCSLPYLLNSSTGCLPTRAEGVILGSGSQLLVSFSTCIVSCFCFPGHLHCRWGGHYALALVYDYGQADLHTSAWRNHCRPIENQEICQYCSP